MFEGNIENIDSTDMIRNMQEIENHLFELKTNLQTLMNFMGEIIEQPTQSPQVWIFQPSKNKVQGMDTGVQCEYQG